MAEAVTLTKARARGIAVRAQLLTAPAPTDLLDVAHRLTAIQADPTAAVAPSAELVCWSRLGERYQPGDLDGALARGALIEFQGMIRPAADLDLFRAEMRQWRDPAELTGWQQSTAEWVELNDGCRRDILALLRTDGPLPAKAFPDTTDVPWRSSGWNDGRNVRMLLELMERREEAETEAGRIEAELTAAQGEVSAAEQRRDDAVADIDDELRRAAAERAGLLDGLPADLIGLYEQIRGRGRTAAGALNGGRCEACRMDLDRSALNDIWAAPPDAVVRCSECGAILIRT